MCLKLEIEGNVDIICQREVFKLGKGKIPGDYNDTSSELSASEAAQACWIPLEPPLKANEAAECGHNKEEAVENIVDFLNFLKKVEADFLNKEEAVENIVDFLNIGMMELLLKEYHVNMFCLLAFEDSCSMLC